MAKSNKKRAKKSKSKVKAFFARLNKAVDFDWNRAGKVFIGCLVGIAGYAAFIGAFIGVLTLAEKVAGSPFGGLALVLALLTVGLTVAAGFRKL